MTSQWARWRLKSPASRLFIQPFIHAQIKENIKAPRHWHLCGEFTETGEFPAQRASNEENVSIWWRHHESWCCCKEGGVRKMHDDQITVHWNFNPNEIIDDYIIPISIPFNFRKPALQLY